MRFCCTDTEAVIVKNTAPTTWTLVIKSSEVEF